MLTVLIDSERFEARILFKKTNSKTKTEIDDILKTFKTFLYPYEKMRIRIIGNLDNNDTEVLTIPLKMK